MPSRAQHTRLSSGTANVPLHSSPLPAQVSQARGLQLQLRSLTAPSPAYCHPCWDLSAISQHSGRSLTVPGLRGDEKRSAVNWDPSSPGDVFFSAVWEAQRSQAVQELKGAV